MASDDKVLEFVVAAGALAQKQAACIKQLTDERNQSLTQKQAADKKNTDLVKQAADALLEAGFIGHAQREDAIRHLATPANVLEVLTKVAKQRPAMVDSLGAPTGAQKTASATGRKAPAKRESDLAFERHLNSD